MDTDKVGELEACLHPNGHCWSIPNSQGVRTCLWCSEWTQEAIADSQASIRRLVPDDGQGA